MLMNEIVNITRHNVPQSEREEGFCEIRKPAKMAVIRNIAKNRGDRIVLIRSEEGLIR